MNFGYPAYRLAALLSRYLPLQWSYGLADQVSLAFFRASPVQREAIGRNHLRIRRHQGREPGKEAILKDVRETYRLFGRYLVDFFRYSVSAKRGLERRVRVEGLAHLDAALARGRGVLLATAHIGNWELGGLILSLRGYPLTVVYRPMSSPRVNRMFLQQRRKRGLDPVPLGQAASGIVRALRKGRVAAILADRDFSGDPLEATFFGAPAHMPRGPSILSHRIGSPLLPGFMLREPDGGFRMELFPAIDPEQHPSPESVQSALVRSLEDVIGRHPTQWFVFEDFWSGAGKSPTGSAERSVTK